MRTALFLAAGFLFLGATSILARLFSETYPGASTWAIALFLLVWLAVTALNMWAGVTHAGYSAKEEFPILLLLFGVPAAVAVILKWKVL